MPGPHPEWLNQKAWWGVWQGAQVQVRAHGFRIQGKRGGKKTKNVEGIEKRGLRARPAKSCKVRTQWYRVPAHGWGGRQVTDHGDREGEEPWRRWVHLGMGENPLVRASGMSSYTKMTSWVKNMEEIRGYLYAPNVGNDFLRHSSVPLKEMSVIFAYIQIRVFCSPKDAIMRKKRRATN